MKINTRHMARECVVQALYSWQLSGNDCTEIQTEVLLERDVKQVDLRFFKDLFSAIVAIAPQLDEEMEPYLSRKLEELGQIERAILRLAVYELSRRMDVPYKVVINEAIELTKTFGAQDSHKFINGVLDKMRPVLRVKA